MCLKIEFISSREMLHTKSGIPRLVKKRNADASCVSKPLNERNDCIHSSTTTNNTKTTKSRHIEVNLENITDSSESSTAEMACKTMIATRVAKTGHLVVASKDSLPTNVEVGGNFSESSAVQPVRRTFVSALPASRAKNVAVISASTDVNKVADCRLKSLAGGLPNPKSKSSLKTVTMPTTSGLLQQNLLGYNHDKQNGDERSENGSDESCPSTINHETAQSEAKSLNELLQLFTKETETLAESLH